MRAGSDIGYCDSYQNKVAMQLPTETEIEAIINACGVIAERVAYTLDDKLLIEFDYKGNYVSEYLTLDEIDSIKEIIDELKA